MKCGFCGDPVNKTASAINRAKKDNRKLYCDRKCAGLSRRINKSIDVKKEEKRLYDIEYRNKNKDLLKRKKGEYFQRTYDPVEAAKKRALTMDRHVEYCRKPEYRLKKKAYDRIYKAKQTYGHLWEHQLLILEIYDEVNKEGRAKIKYDNGCTNKTQNRKRENERLNSEKFERNTLGNTECSKR